MCVRHGLSEFMPTCKQLDCTTLLPKTLLGNNKQFILLFGQGSFEFLMRIYRRTLTTLSNFPMDGYTCCSFIYEFYLLITDILPQLKSIW